MYEIGQEEIDAVAKVINSRYLFRYGKQNGEVESMEKDICRRLGVKHFLAMSNGTAAIICGLIGMGIGPGDEVIIPAYTFAAVPSAVPHLF